MLSGFVLKVVAVACMLIDHMGYAFDWAPSWFRIVGRVALPIFVFLVAEGCRHTKSIEKYMLRLAVFAVVSQIPFYLVFSHGQWSSINIAAFARNTNIFYTLTLGVFSIALLQQLQKRAAISVIMAAASLVITAMSGVIWYALDYMAGISFRGFAISGSFIWGTVAVSCAYVLLYVLLRLNDAEDKERKSSVLVQICSVIAVLPVFIMAVVLDTDYGMVGVMLVLLVYIAKDRPFQVIALSVALSLFYVSTSWLIMWRGVALALFVSMVLLALYNGKRGIGGRGVQYGFYAFYPLHLMAIWILTLS